MAISLAKGQKINLKKNNGSDLTTFCVGANWGAIEKKGIFGTKKEAVDLDLSVGIFDNNKNLSEVIYFGNLKSSGIILVMTEQVMWMEMMDWITK